ncbi:MAG TPA: LPS-assembly protein LptD [Usitatibacter sp.]
MSRRSTRTLALAAALAIFQAYADDADGLHLKIEKQLRMAPERPERDGAKFLEADQVEGDQNKKLTATGNVVLRQRGAIVRADRLDYFSDDQKAIATGNVRIDRGGDVATGPRLEYHMDTDTGTMDQPILNLAKTPERRTSSRGQSERAILEPERKTRLMKAEYTSCPVPRDDWFMRVNELLLDSEKNIGQATHGTVYFLGAPILYAPFMTFALDNKRKSGFLAPTFGTSGQSGFEVALPYYWNIAPNMDATITPKLLTKRGMQIGAEFRYLEPKFSGQIDAEFLPNDRIAEQDRYFLGIHHAQQLWGGWTANLNAQRVSDDAYFRDLTTKIALTSQTNLPRDLVFSYASDIWSLSARVLGYQTLQDITNDVPIPYNILPQLTALGSGQNFHGIDWQIYSELSNFRHPVLTNGQRFIVNPSVSYPMTAGYGYITPKIGYSFTRYNVDPNNSQGLLDASRSLPIASLDAGLFFDRLTTIGGTGYLQTLEPRLFYLYVPFRDQTQLPNFTTAEADFNFQRIFSENRFVGGDRIGDANQLTIALTSRLVDSATGLERLKMGIGQAIYFEPPRVTLSSELPPPSKSSDLLGFVSGEVAKFTTVDAGLQYTPSNGQSEKIYVGAHYAPEPGSIFNAAYRYTRGSTDPNDPAGPTGIQQVDFSTQWPIFRNVQALARWNYSLVDHKLIEGLAGFEYNAGCWQLRAVAHRFITATQTYSTSFQIQLELTGLSRIGINPLETLRQNISGYRRSAEIPQ